LETPDGDILLDGHNRYEVSKRNNLEFKVIKKSFEGRDQAKIWVICTQLSRRNLTPAQAMYLCGVRYELEKGPRGGYRHSNSALLSLNGSVAKKLGKEYGVSENTIIEDGKFAAAVDKLSPEEKSEVLAGRKKGRDGRGIFLELRVSPTSRIQLVG